MVFHSCYQKVERSASLLRMISAPSLRRSRQIPPSKNLLLYSGEGSSPCVFKYPSHLKDFLTAEFPYSWLSTMNMETVFRMLDQYISRYNLFEPTNCEIILCDANLFLAFGRKAFHYSEMAELVSKHISFFFTIPPSEQVIVGGYQVMSSWATMSTKMDKICRAKKVCAKPLSESVSTFYFVRPEFFEIINPYLSHLSGNVVALNRFPARLIYQGAKESLNDANISQWDPENGTIILTQGTQWEKLTGARLISTLQITPIIRDNVSLQNIFVLSNK